MSDTINYLRYKRKYIGKFVDMDGAYGYQCMDLIRSYCKEVHGFNMGRTPQARDVNNTHTLPGRQKLVIGKDDFKRGDIITLDLGKYGHIGIVDRTDATGVYILEQNGSGKQSGAMIKGNEIRVKKYKRGLTINCFRSNK